MISKSFPDIYTIRCAPRPQLFASVLTHSDNMQVSFKLTVTKKIEVFGSYARGEQKETSNLEVIVEFKKRKSLLELVGIEQEFSISPYLKVILNE